MSSTKDECAAVSDRGFEDQMDSRLASLAVQFVTGIDSRPELSSFSSGELAAIQGNLQAAANPVSEVLSRRESCVTFEGTATNMTQASNSPVSPASPTKTSEPYEWILNITPGTSVKDFKEFIKGLPDHGAGEQIIFPSLDYQNYVGKMTRDEARVVNQIPIVDMIELAGPRKIIEISGLNSYMHSRAYNEEASEIYAIASRDRISIFH
ncbi:MAG: hypothetical protein Q9181_002675 [Wetmoreana brouardii]